MTHDEAKKSMAAEAYVLDDLEAAERNAFEEHFFDCTDCTADVLDAAKIADGVRTGSTNVVPFPHHYSRWVAAAAAAAVAIGLAYNYMPRPQGLPPGTPIRSIAHQQAIDLDASRAAQAPFVVIGNEPVLVGFVIPVLDPRPPYVCELRDDAGVIIGVKTVDTKEKASNPVSMVITAGKFHSGHYTLGIRGDREIPAYDFAVEVH
jgi:anti-sigma factor RsiW